MLSRARAAGVSTILAIGHRPRPEKTRRRSPLRRAHDWIYTTVGIHPHDAKEFTPSSRNARRPRQIIRSSRLGEIGSTISTTTPARSPRAHLPPANGSRPPQNSHHHPLPRRLDDCLRISPKTPGEAHRLGGILHCFTQHFAHAQKGLDMGFLISFTGNISYPKAQNIRDVAKALPLSNILIETDSPYLAPATPPRASAMSPRTFSR